MKRERKKSKAWLLVLVLALIVSSVMMGCGDKKDVPVSEKKITYNLGAEPEILDPALQTGLPESTVLNAVMEGLYRYGPDKKLLPGIAENVSVLDDGKKYVFKIRKGARWTNGDPVNAHDFEYSWKRLLDPRTGAEYAYEAFCIKNGEKFNMGQVGAEQVGVRAVDDYTLEVELEAPAPYFLELTAFSNFFPVNRRAVEDDPRWHTRPETYVSNGPFKIAAWEPQQKMVLVKNPSYWDADSVKLDKLVITFVEDANTELAMFKSKKIDVSENPPVSDVKRLISDGTAVVLPEPSTYYYVFNVKKKPFDNKKVRQAFSLAINRKAIVENITQAGEKPALAFVPYGFPDADPGRDFRSAGGSYFKDNDVETARKLLEEAGYPGGRGLPEIEILYNTGESNQKIAEAIAQMWRTGLGVRVSLRSMEWGAFLQARGTGDYMVASAGWSPDYNDPMTYLDINITNSGNNVSFWSNKTYDKLISQAKATNDQKIRMRKMHEAEKILMDEMPLAPIYFYVNVNMYQPWIKGVFVPPFGSYQEFKWADVSGKVS